MDFSAIKTINNLKRDVLEEFIKTLPKEDKDNLKKFLQEHPQTNAAGIFNTVRAYIFNTYFRTTPRNEKSKTTFAETLNFLLDDNNEEDNKNE